MAAFGVHLGTCSACLAVSKEGKAEVIANDLGDRVTPCVVAFTDLDMIVGAAAKQGIIRNAQNTVCHVKRILGRPFNDPVCQEFKSISSVKLVEQNQQSVFVVQYKEKTQYFTAEQITETIYRKMLETAQSHGGSGIKDAVLAVPSDFSLQQRQVASVAASKAGFNVLRMINECSAAALAYDLGQTDTTDKFKALVYRLGGMSHDATILQVQNGMYRILGASTDHSFGSDSFTEVLQKFLAAEFRRMNKANPLDNKRSMAKLMLSAEDCKHTLARLDNAHCNIDSLYDGVDFHINISRARFESLCSGEVVHCTQLIQQVLDKTNVSADAISKVILCGGGTKMLLVQRTIASFVPTCEVLCSIDGDEVIAIGAAKEASILSGKEKAELEVAENENKFPCLTKDIGIQLTSGMESVLPAGTLIPFRTTHVATLAPDQTAFALVVCEAGDKEDDVSPLAKVVLRGLPAGAAIQTSFHLRREGGLHVTCHEVSTGQQESIHIPFQDIALS